MGQMGRKIVAARRGTIRVEPLQGELPLDDILDDQEIQNILVNDDTARNAITDLVVANGRDGIPGLFGRDGIPGLPRELADGTDGGNADLTETSTPAKGPHRIGGFT